MSGPTTNLLDQIDLKNREKRGTAGIVATADVAPINREFEQQRVIADLYKGIPTSEDQEDYSGIVSYSGEKFKKRDVQEAAPIRYQLRNADGELVLDKEGKPIEREYRHTVAKGTPSFGNPMTDEAIVSARKYDKPDMLKEATERGMGLEVAFRGLKDSDPQVRTESLATLKDELHRLGGIRDLDERELIAKRFLEKMLIDLGPAKLTEPERKHLKAVIETYAKDFKKAQESGVIMGAVKGTLDYLPGIGFDEKRATEHLPVELLEKVIEGGASRLSDLEMSRLKAAIAAGEKKGADLPPEIARLLDPDPTKRYQEVPASTLQRAQLAMAKLGPMAILNPVGALTDVAMAATKTEEPKPSTTDDLLKALSIRLKRGPEAPAYDEFSNFSPKEQEKIAAVIDAALKTNPRPTREQIMLGIVNSLDTEVGELADLDKLTGKVVAPIDYEAAGKQVLKSFESFKGTADEAAVKIVTELERALQGGEIERMIRLNPNFEVELKKAIGEEKGQAALNAAKFAFQTVGGSPAAVRAVFQFKQAAELSPEGFVAGLRKFDPADIAAIRRYAESELLLGPGKFDKLLESKLSPDDLKIVREFLEKPPVNLWITADDLLANPPNQVEVIKGLSTDQISLLRSLYERERKELGKDEPTLIGYVEKDLDAKLATARKELEAAERAVASAAAKGIESKEFSEAEKADGDARATLAKLEDQKTALMSALYKPEAATIKQLLDDAPEYDPEQERTKEQVAEAAEYEAEIVKVLKRNPTHGEYIDRAFDAVAITSSFEEVVQTNLGPESFIRINLLAVNGLEPDAGQKLVDELGLGKDPKAANVDRAVQQLTAVSARARRGLIQAAESIAGGSFDDLVRKLETDKKVSADDADRFLAAARGLDSKAASEALVATVKRANAKAEALAAGAPAVAQNTMLVFSSALAMEGNNPVAAFDRVQQAFGVLMSGRIDPSQAGPLAPTALQLKEAITRTASRFQDAGVDPDEALAMAINFTGQAIQDEGQGLIRGIPPQAIVSIRTESMQESSRAEDSGAIYDRLFQMIPSEAAVMSEEFRSFGIKDPEFEAPITHYLDTGLDAHKRLIMRAYHKALDVEMRDDLNAKYPELAESITARTLTSSPAAALADWEEGLKPFKFRPEDRELESNKAAPLDAAAQNSLVERLRATLASATPLERHDARDLLRNIYGWHGIDFDAELPQIFTDPAALTAIRELLSIEEKK